MTTIWIGAVVAAALGFALWLEARRRRTEAEHETIRDRAVAAGMNEPPTLHPLIDPDVCIGSGACVAACPEGVVIGIVDGRGTLVTGSKCVGHGRCFAECPVGAIRLVFGTSERGVDIPHVSPSFESNVPGLYIAGELGGMGLVRNAVRQGVEAMQDIARRLAEAGPRPGGVHDVIIVGAGPAGVAAAVTAKQAGLDLRIFDREARFGGAILHFPRHKLVMTEPMKVPGYGAVKAREIPKEELLQILAAAVERSGVRVEGGREVASVKGEGEGAARRFRVVLQGGEELLARAVVLAIGRRGMPNRIGVPGEEQAKVAYSLLEPEHYRGRRVVVVGGGNSAVEAALALGDEPGTEVTLSYRRAAFGRIAEKNRARLDAAAAAGRVRVRLETQPAEIRGDAVLLDGPQGREELPNDFVFVFAGGVLPAEFLAGAGVRVERKYGEP